MKKTPPRRAMLISKPPDYCIIAVTQEFAQHMLVWQRKTSHPLGFPSPSERICLSQFIDRASVVQLDRSCDEFTSELSNRTLRPIRSADGIVATDTVSFLTGLSSGETSSGSGPKPKKRTVLRSTVANRLDCFVALFALYLTLTYYAYNYNQNWRGGQVANVTDH